MTDAPLPKYYLPGEVKSLRDGDRRYYRRRILWLIAYQFSIVIPIRYAIDFVISTPKFHAEFLRPYILPALAITVVLIWLLGLPGVFKRRY